MKTMQSFWPEPSKSELTPAEVLEQQAEHLEEKFGKKLRGQVVTSYKDDNGLITVSFYLVHTSLRGYNYRLLWFDQRIETIYPFRVMAFSAPPDDFGEASSITDFTGMVRNILSSPRTERLLSHLLTLGQIVEGDA